MASKPPYPREAHIVKKEKGSAGKSKTIYELRADHLPIPIPLSANTIPSKKRWIPKSAMRMKAKADHLAAGYRVLPPRRCYALSIVTHHDGVTPA